MSAVWIVIPSEGESQVFVWNFVTRKWHERTLDRLAHAITHMMQYDDIIDHDSGITNLDNSIIDSARFLRAKLIGIAEDADRLAILDSGGSGAGADITAYARHESYDFSDVEGAGPERVKHITSLRPHFSSVLSEGAEIYFRIGTQMDLSDEITWSDYKTFAGKETRDLYFRVAGRYISWEIRSLGHELWELDGMDIVYQLGGVY